MIKKQTNQKIERNKMSDRSAPLMKCVLFLGNHHWSYKKVLNWIISENTTFTE